MAKFLDTTGVSYHLQQLINKAKEKLILVSPYLKINERVKQSLIERDAFKLDIRIIYGKSELQPSETEWIQSVKSIRLSFCKNLHAKCYLNESEAIITSMNLYEFSQVNNAEMGIYISKAEDPVVYQDLSEEVQRLLRMSDEVQISIERTKPEVPPQIPIPPSPTPAPQRKKAEPAIASQPAGHCIRCQDEIPLRPTRPYCRECHDDWDGDDSEPEMYCHVCGTDHNATFLKPSCYPCFKANRNKLEWAVS
ncbi:hypothetical protein D7Y13_05450 [Corallococcus praedator]|uniref:Phospholipase D-like domain-containing protein n=1 Tax=Corallococcus praedator TaxID=2316724 RepID=A0ABX9QNM7_9BACT|nr:MULTISPECIES: phospholipase D family protein [Corallococcus]RKH33620.1 hypothetical protein D7X75_11460 [Corallococcus sp. CA031C]RKI14804.1 hypothetical protein D7Y13_05450 [Corallococcus praedator]